jgi:uncharacterized membrane protein (UPF0127 family)
LQSLPGIVVLTLFVGFYCSCSLFAKTTPELIDLRLGTVRFKAEVAKTANERSKGMMFREDFGPAQAMLFIFPREEIQVFWMKNTRFPLSIGFFNRNFELVDIQEMLPPQSEIQVSFPKYTSSSPAQFVVEAPRGWFDQNRIKKGARLQGDSLPRLRSEVEEQSAN